MAVRSPLQAKRGRSYHHGDLKQALRDAALELIRERGAESVSLREISQAAGVSHTAAYRHYADKQALLADLAEEAFRTLDRIHRRTIESTAGGPADQLAACGRDYVRFAIDNPHLLSLMFGNVIIDWHAHPSLVLAGQGLATTLETVVRAGQAAGVFRAGDPRELALAAWSLVHGLSSLIVGRRVPHRGAPRGYVERGTETCIKLLMGGISALPKQRRR